MKHVVQSVFLLGTIMTFGCGSPESHFSQHHDSKSYFQILNQSIKPGFTISKVQELLGPEWTAPTSSSPMAVRNIQLQIAKQSSRKSPDNPDGVQDNDAFLFYSLDDYTRGFHLQFRNGRLINFNPDHYSEVQRKKMLNLKM